MLAVEAASFLGVDINELRAFIASEWPKLADERLRLEGELDSALSAYREGDWSLAIKTVESTFRACFYAGSPVGRTGRQVLATYEEANKKRALDSAEQTRKWQSLANEKWAQDQHKGKSARAIASLIAEDGENPETIRRKIKKKLA
jgi:hypothetical protein